jgi:hypothetical protein
MVDGVALLARRHPIQPVGRCVALPAASDGFFPGIYDSGTADILPGRFHCLVVDKPCHFFDVPSLFSGPQKGRKTLQKAGFIALPGNVFIVPILD